MTLSVPFSVLGLNHGKVRDGDGRGTGPSVPEVQCKEGGFRVSGKEEERAARGPGTRLDMTLQHVPPLVRPHLGLPHPEDSGRGGS